jgi:hypothetical protein
MNCKKIQNNWILKLSSIVQSENNVVILLLYLKNYKWQSIVIRWLLTILLSTLLCNHRLHHWKMKNLLFCSAGDVNHMVSDIRSSSFFMLALAENHAPHSVNCNIFIKQHSHDISQNSNIFHYFKNYSETILNFVHLFLTCFVQFIWIYKKMKTMIRGQPL